jgi:hypothetical protein
MTNRKVIYDTPEGELILFHNETQFKHFICNLGLAPEDLEDLGIHVEFDPVEEEYVCELEMQKHSCSSIQSRQIGRRIKQLLDRAEQNYV